jgi:hypothetical protein
LRIRLARAWQCRVLAFWLDEQWSRAKWFVERISSITWHVPCSYFYAYTHRKYFLKNLSE